MNVETARMSERGQMIIPKSIREEIKASKDTLFALSTLDQNTVIMKKMDTSGLMEEFKSLRKKAKKLSPAKIEEEINAARKA